MITHRFCLVLGIILAVTNLSHAQTDDTCSVFKISRDSQETGNTSACLGGPVLGLTFNEAVGQVNAILGIPGSLRLDDPLELGFRLDSAHLSGQQTYALAVSSGDRKVLSLDVRGRAIYIREPEVPSDPAKISLSSAGNFAALFYPAVRQIFVVSELPEANLAWIADTSVTPDEIVALSISDDGSRVLAATAGGGVYSFTKDGTSLLAAFMTTPGVTRFLRNSHDAVIADQTEKRLYYYSEEAGGAWSFASEAEGVLSPLDIAISDNNDRVFLVNENSENIVAVSLQTGQTTSVACNCLPRKLARLQGSTLFALTSVTDSSFLLFQPTMTGGEILFVPIPPKASSPPEVLVIDNAKQPSVN